MASRGSFNRGRGGKGRKVNFKDQHDDRWNDSGDTSYDNQRMSGWQGGGRGRGRGRGGGGQGGRWTRGGGPRGKGNRGGVNPRSRLEGDYGDDSGDYGSSSNSQGRNRYTPYNKSPPSGGKGGSSRGSVFNRLGREPGGGGASGRGKGSVFGRLSGLGQNDSQGQQNWHKITLNGAGNEDHDSVLQELQQQIEEPFQPQQVHSKGDKLMFFIEEHRAANQLKGLQNPAILVKPSPPPRGNTSGSGGKWGRGGGASSGWNSGGGGWRDMGGGERRVSFQRGESTDMMEEDTTSVLLEVLGKRYDAMNMSLDLSDMFHDEILQQHKIRGSMFDTGFVNAILDQIAIRCPNLNALYLNRNKLQRLQAYSSLKEKCPHLQILDLSENELRNTKELEAIAPLTSVTTLVLENNPFQEHLQDFAAYAGNLRKYFPNLLILDGQQLPGPIKFDLPASTGSLPPSQKGYLVNDEVRSLVVSFLEQFYSLYDGESRDKLLEAYSDTAVFSLSLDIQQQQQQQRGPPFHQYMPLSRNLVRVREAGKRSSLIKHGRIDIVQCLRQLPRSFHIASSFSVDVMKASPMCTGFTVYGVFAEASSNSKMDSHPIRSFCRTFIIVAAGTGVAIINDQLTIRNPNFDTVKQYQDEVQEHFTRLQPSPPPFMSSSTVPMTSPFSQSSSSMSFDPSHSTLVQPVAPFTSHPPQPSYSQDEIVGQFSLESRMNLEWSKKCLTENGWNYDKAIAAFKLLNSQGNIPPQAFQPI